MGQREDRPRERAEITGKPCAGLCRANKAGKERGGALPYPDRNHCTGVKLANVNVIQQEAEKIADSIDICDAMSAKIQQLRSMLVLISGEGLDAFESMSTELKANYLWACSTLAGDCVSFLEPLSSAMSRERTGT